MKAIRHHRYGSADVLALEDIDPPPVGDDDVLVRIKAAAVNPLDVRFMTGTPYVMRVMLGLSRPRSPGLGGDLAGIVEAVGRNVTAYRPGDEVFGGRGLAPVDRAAAFAEYASLRQDRMLVKKPAGITFEQAAAVPVAGLSALQALRDMARVQAGHRVLVNGAGGGVGTFAVQIAKSYGAEVTGVCGAGKAELVRSLGADHVIDYTREDFTRSGRRYDAVIDMAGNHPLPVVRRVLARKGVYVGVGGPLTGMWLAPFTGPGKALAYSLLVSQSMKPFLARWSVADLAVLGGLVEAGKITPVVGRTYPLSAVPDAIRHFEAGHAAGKIVIVP